MHPIRTPITVTLLMTVAVAIQAAEKLTPEGSLGLLPDWIESIAYSPDGQRVAAGSYELIRLFDPAEEEGLGDLKVNGSAKAVAFSPDSSLLAGGAYQQAKLWKVTGREEAGQLEGHRGYVTGVVFSPDGKRLATSCEDGAVRIWDVSNLQLLQTFKEHQFAVQDVAFSADGKRLASVGGDRDRVTKPGEVFVWDADSGELLHRLPEHGRAATAVAFSPDGRWLASTSEDEKVNIYEVATGKALGFFGEHGRPTNDVLFLNNDTLVSAAGGRAQGGNLIKVWNREDGEEQLTLTGHGGRITCLALSPDGRNLLSSGHDRRVLRWKMPKPADSDQ